MLKFEHCDIDDISLNDVLSFKPCIYVLCGVYYFILYGECNLKLKYSHDFVCYS